MIADRQTDKQTDNQTDPFATHSPIIYAGEGNNVIFVSDSLGIITVEPLNLKVESAK